MKKLILLFYLFLTIFTAFLLVLQASISPLILGILFISVAIIGLTLGSLLLNLYFEPFYNYIKSSYTWFIIMTVVATVVSMIFYYQLSEENKQYTYVPVIILFIVGTILLVTISTKLKRQNILYSVNWTSIFFRNEKIEQLEKDEIKDASNKLYQLTLFLFLAGIITGMINIIAVVGCLVIIFSLKQLKKVAVYFNTKGYVVIEALFILSVVISVIVYYVTDDTGYLILPMMTFFIFKLMYYRFLKKKSLQLKTRSY